MLEKKIVIVFNSNLITYKIKWKKISNIPKIGFKNVDLKLI